MVVTIDLGGTRHPVLTSLRRQRGRDSRSDALLCLMRGPPKASLNLCEAPYELTDIVWTGDFRLCLRDSMLCSSDLVHDDMISKELWEVGVHDDAVVSNDDVKESCLDDDTALINHLVADESPQILTRRGICPLVRSQLALRGTSVVKTNVVLGRVPCLDDGRKFVRRKHLQRSVCHAQGLVGGGGLKVGGEHVLKARVGAFKRTTGNPKKSGSFPSTVSTEKISAWAPLPAMPRLAWRSLSLPMEANSRAASGSDAMRCEPVYEENTFNTKCWYFLHNRCTRRERRAASCMTRNLLGRSSTTAARAVFAILRSLRRPRLVMTTMMPTRKLLQPVPEPLVDARIYFKN
eukprot:418329-Prymnesium_polylepis.2